MNTLPSSAYSSLPSISQAMVVSRPFSDVMAFVPVFISMKQPVPYVFFVLPGWKAFWPNNAAC
ncbi:hypothetical protein D3C80_1662710 [compost metagenome]